MIINPPNLAIWHNYPLADEMRRAYKVPVKVDNDANAAALAESGAGPRLSKPLLCQRGTGIGTGIIFEAHIYHGKTGAAAEGGHVGLTAAALFAIAENAAALKRWLRVPPLPGEHAKNSS